MDASSMTNKSNQNSYLYGNQVQSMYVTEYLDSQISNNENSSFVKLDDDRFEEMNTEKKNFANPDPDRYDFSKNIL